jgi:hypothetical protein
MAVTTQISALPAVPDRSMSSAAFVAAANAFLGSLPVFRTQINAVAAEINATANDINAAAAATQIASANAVAAAASAINSPATFATHTGSLTVSVGSKTFVLDQTDKLYAAGQYVAIADEAAAAARRMTGLVTSYNAGTRQLTVAVDNIDAGTGQTQNTTWRITVSARAGLPAATVAEIRAGLIASGAITPQGLAAASAFIALVDAPTVVWDTALGFNAIIGLNGSRVMGTPTSLKDGWTYTLGIFQAGGGGWTLSWPAIFDWGEAGPPVLSTGNGKADFAYGQYCAVSGKIHMNFRKAA